MKRLVAECPPQDTRSIRLLLRSDVVRLLSEASRPRPLVPTMVSVARVAFALIVFGTAAAALGIVGSGPEFSDRLKAIDEDVMIDRLLLIVVILAVVGVGCLVYSVRVNAKLQADLRDQDRKAADDRFDIITRMLVSTGALTREAIAEAEAGRTDVAVLRRDVA